MQLDRAEEQLIQGCRMEKSSWVGWEWCFFGVGTLLFGFGILVLYLMSAMANPQDLPEDARQAVVVCTILAFVLGLYLCDSGVHERCERKLRRLLLKSATQLGEQS